MQILLVGDSSLKIETNNAALQKGIYLFGKLGWWREEFGKKKKKLEQTLDTIAIKFVLAKKIELLHPQK